MLSMTNYKIGDTVYYLSEDEFPLIKKGIITNYSIYVVDDDSMNIWLIDNELNISEENLFNTFKSCKIYALNAFKCAINELKEIYDHINKQTEND